MIVFKPQKVMISEYTIKIIETDWCSHVVWYIQYFWWEVKWVEHDTKTDEVHDKDCVEQEFQLQFYQKLGRTVEGSEVK